MIKIGLHYSFQVAALKDSSAVIRQALDDIAAADRDGFSSVVFAEHHFLEDGWIPRPMQLAAAAAAITTRMRVGTDIVILALHHPVAVAEEAAVADVLSGGRFVVAWTEENVDNPAAGTNIGARVCSSQGALGKAAQVNTVTGGNRFSLSVSTTAGLSGDLKVMPMQDLALYLGNRQLSGTLTLTPGTLKKTASLLNGIVVASSSNDPREYFSQFLINFGYLTEDQLTKAMKTQQETKVSLCRLVRA